MDMEDWEMLNTEEHGSPSNITKLKEEESKFNPDTDDGVVNMDYFTCVFPPSSLLNNKINVEAEDVQEVDLSKIKEVRSLALLPDVLAEMGIISELFMGKLEDDSVNMKIEHPKCIIREFYQSEDSEDYNSSEELSFRDEDDYGDGNNNDSSQSRVKLWGSRLIGAAAATLCVLLLSGCPKPRLQNQEIEDPHTSVSATLVRGARGANISFQDLKK
ncbi:Ammonium/urea transporter domain-containing protein [Dioscorea alata]|uniref:Ammonium/urea transporter domain-containing protein n=1 Tax=Dioscorea alata TaxID=55571 RepID=A0ACB7TSA9_DIOAL|nr:Ammonium/urea transporter domain-containing protein [Dioscorea alata]